MTPIVVKCSSRSLAGWADSIVRTIGFVSYAPLDSGTLQLVVRAVDRLPIH